MSADHKLHLVLAHLIRWKNLQTVLIIDQIKGSIYRCGLIHQ